MTSIFPTAAFIVVCAAAVFQIVFIIRKVSDRTSLFFLGGAGLLLFAELVTRSMTIGFPAVTGLFESLVFFSGCLAIILCVYGLVSRRKNPEYVLSGGTVLILALLAVASSPVAPGDVLPPIPALRSNWLVLHVTFAFLGEAFFALAFTAAVVRFFIRSPDGKLRLGSLVHRAVVIGYPFFTAGALVFGAVWAEAAWGAWWSWDPKETWALITWLVYTVYLHMNRKISAAGSIAVLLPVIGFLCALFTLFGVNFLLSGLHSYR